VSAEWTYVKIFKNSYRDDKLENRDENQHAHFAVTLHLCNLARHVKNNYNTLTPSD
jgi:hypothetical protein